MKVYAYILLVVLLPCMSKCSIDLYLAEDQVEKLFGIADAEMYYIRNGIINENAVNFVAHVQPEHTDLTYLWKVTNKAITVAYDLDILDVQKSPAQSNTGSVDMDKHSILYPPKLESKSGTIRYSEDLQPQTLKVSLVCTGEREGNVTVTMKLKLVLDSGTDLVVNIKRLKKCSKTHSFVEDKPVLTDQPNEPNDQDLNLGGTQQSTSAFYISVSVVSSFIVLIVVGVTLWHVRMSKRYQRSGVDNCIPMQPGAQHLNQFLRPDLPNNALKPPSHSSLMQIITPLINDLGTDINEIQSKLSAIAIPRENLDIGELTLKGTFARIYKGKLDDGTPVLIKTVSDMATEEQKRLLLFESSLLRGMHHRNLLSMKHVVLQDDSTPPMVLFHFMEGGNLKHYLQGLKLKESPGLVSGIFGSGSTKYEQVSTQDLVEMAIQIACGMTYLSKRGLVHKDLAARNCVIDRDLKVKISDNALSRDAFPADYCCLGDNENRPVRWLGLESLVHKVYSSASDVWSFGVLLWELQSLAATPYADIDDFEMASYLKDGFRLSQPINCPDHLYSIIASCWHYSPDQRPSFTKLLQMLTEFYAELEVYV
ncbi:tyrosine-protein kinase RYK [Ciona intestinalis]